MSATETTTLRAPELHVVVSWIDARARDASGRRLGRVKAIVADRHGTPWWIVLRHHGRDVVAPVGAVCAARHREIVLDRMADSLVPCPADFDAATHRALIARYGACDAKTPPRRRDACAGRAWLWPRRPLCDGAEGSGGGISLLP